MVSAGRVVYANARMHDDKQQVSSRGTPGNGSTVPRLPHLPAIFVRSLGWAAGLAVGPSRSWNSNSSRRSSVIPRSQTPHNPQPTTYNPQPAKWRRLDRTTRHACDMQRLSADLCPSTVSLLRSSCAEVSESHIRTRPDFRAASPA